MSPPPDPPPVPSALPAPTPAPLPIPPPTSVGSEPRSATPSLAWALLASAGALVAGGVTANVVGNANAAVYDDDARCLYGDLTRDQRCGSFRDRAEAASALAVAGYALGAATGIASGVVFLLASNHRTKAGFFRVRFWARRWTAGGGSDGRNRGSR